MMALLGLVAALVAVLVLFGGWIAYARSTQPVATGPAAPVAPAPVIRYTTLVGFDEAGGHITEIWLREKPAGSYGVNRAVYTAHEGDRVAVLEQYPDDTVKVRTDSGIEGWTQIYSLKDPH